MATCESHGSGSITVKYYREDGGACPLCEAIDRADAADRAFAVEVTRHNETREKAECLRKAADELIAVCTERLPGDGSDSWASNLTPKQQGKFDAIAWAAKDLAPASTGGAKG